MLTQKDTTTENPVLLLLKSVLLKSAISNLTQT